MYRLFIEGVEAELNQSADVQIQKTIIDLSDISKRGMKFTNAFTLPISNTNRKIFGYPSRLASNNRSFERKYSYQLLNSNSILSTGDAVLKEYDDKKGIKIQLLEGFDFWSLAGQKKLDDVVNHGDDFLFNNANMDALKLKSSSVFLTALHTTTGNKTDTALTTYQYTRPCINFRSVLDKICADVGYSVDYGNVIQFTQLEDIGSLSNAKDFFVSDFKYRFEQFAFSGGLQIDSGDPVIAPYDSTTLSGDTLTFNTYKTGIVIKGTITAPNDTTLLIEFSDRTERIAISRGTNFINYRSDSTDIGNTCQISCADVCTFDDVYIYSVLREGDVFDIREAIDISNLYVLGDYNLPLMTYQAFVKLFCKMFFLDVVADPQTKTLQFHYMAQDIDSNNVTDLTDNIQRNHTVKPGKVYGKLNAFSYANDNDIDSELGRAYFTTENENAPPTKEFISISEFSASDEITASGETIITASIYDVAEEKRQSVSDRIVFFADTGAFGFNAVFSPIAWPRLYSDHYFDLIENTKRERPETLDVKINSILFSKLQRNPVIYDGGQESNFLISSIKKFDEKNLAVLEVVKFG